MDSYDEYMVSEVKELQPIDREVIALLYQPIIGSIAHSLFTTLWGEVSPSSLERINRHDWLLTTLNIDVNQFERARRQLEGIGLLRTYQMQTGSHEATYIYELQAPYTPQKFFNDDVLSFLLLDCVGEQRFEQLVAHFQPQKKIPSSYEEITVSFDEVYHLSEWHYRHSTEMLKLAQTTYPAPVDKKMTVETTDFSDEVFKDALANRFSRQTIDQLLPTAHFIATTYGFNELDVVDFVALATDKTGNVTEKKVQSIAIQAYELNQAAMPTENVQWQSSEFTTEEQQILTMAAQEAPLSFIKILKREQNGIVTSQERFAIQSAVSSGIPNVMINILVYYLIVGKQQSEIRRQQFDSLLNRISQLMAANAQFDAGYLYRHLPQIEESVQDNQALLLQEGHTEEYWLKQGIPTNTARLFANAESTTPQQFLQQTKKHYDALITDKEAWRVRNIVKQNKVPTAVVNLVVYKLIQQSETHELNALFDRVLNQLSQRWSEQTTLSDVWEWLPAMIDRLTHATNKPAKKEGIQPHWEDNDEVAPTDEKRQQEVSERLRRIDQL